MNEQVTRYNVQCIDCGSVWSPPPKSPLWWAAQKHSEQGYIDALGITGDRCGCIKTRREPDAPFRVFGFNMMQEFDMPFHTFVDAVKSFRRLRDSVDDVFISGVSSKVEQQLRWA